MLPGKINMILDAAWGSSGKGKLAAYLAHSFKVTDASCCNMPNAGHTVVENGKSTVFKMLPAGCVAKAGRCIWLGASSVIDTDRLQEELVALDQFDQTGQWQSLYIHGRAAIWRPEYKQVEQESKSLSQIASTAQGCSTAIIRKIERHEDAIRGDQMIPPRIWTDKVRKRLSGSCMWLHEVSQGWALSLNWGTHYPQCTSRDCTTTQALNDIGVPPSFLGDVYLNVRTYPIRVGNTSTGYSGDFLEDQEELSWEEIAKRSGLPLETLKKTEMTTVTKRQRRVASYSPTLTREAAWQNGATKIFINFIEYLDGNLVGKRGDKISELSKPARIFVEAVQEDCNIPVVGVGTGAETNDVIWWGT